MHVPTCTGCTAAPPLANQLLREALEGYEQIGAHGHARRVRDRLVGRVGTAVE